jgi:two-component system, CAI-1 autoinducer sensor kinase/phosphatase CqsS
MWMMTEVLAIFVMALCISAPLLLMAYLIAGILGAFLAVILTSDTPLVLSTADEANLAVLPVIIICSMVFSNAMRRALIEKNKAITALAGSIAHEMRNPLGQMKYALDYIGHLLPTPNTSNTDHVISAKTINDIYSNIAQGLTSCDRGLQVIDITLREVSNQELNPTTFEYLSAASITGKALEE